MSLFGLDVHSFRAGRSDGASRRRCRRGLPRAFYVCLLAALPPLTATVGKAQAAGQKLAEATSQRRGGAGDTGQAPTEHRPARYRLQNQDVVAIAFPLSPEFNETATISPDGYITLIGAGDLFARGLTLPGLVDALQAAYAQILNHPLITVSLKDFQAPFFVVSGQVAKPGQFTLRYDTTVSEAIALAGGLTPAGKSHVYLFRRESDAWFKVTPLKLRDTPDGKRDEDPLLQSGDLIYVPEKFITKFRTYVPYSLGLYTSPQFIF